MSFRDYEDKDVCLIDKCRIIILKKEHLLKVSKDGKKIRVKRKIWQNNRTEFKLPYCYYEDYELKYYPVLTSNFNYYNEGSYIIHVNNPKDITEIKIEYVNKVQEDDFDNTYHIHGHNGTEVEITEEEYRNGVMTENYYIYFHTLREMKNYIRNIMPVVE